MIPASISGITFTVHPMNNKTMLIELAHGVGDRVVSGKVIPDRVVINRETVSIIERTSKEKKIKISSDILIELAKTCLKIEGLFKSPQDIEWCISKKTI